jgi:hypothetical protein
VNDTCVNAANDANCPDDGQFCTGTEYCDVVDDCTATGDPCGAGKTCNESTDNCMEQTVQLPAAARQTACMRRQPPPVPTDCTATVTRPVTVLVPARPEHLFIVVTVSAVPTTRVTR